MGQNIGGFPPWGATLANYPGDRSKYFGAFRTNRDAASRYYPGYNWQTYALGRVTSPLDLVRVKARTLAIADPDVGDSSAIRVAGV